MPRELALLKKCFIVFQHQTKSSSADALKQSFSPLTQFLIYILTSQFSFLLNVMYAHLPNSN